MWFWLVIFADKTNQIEMKKLKYYIAYKPYNMLSQFTKEIEDDITLADLNYKFDKDIYPVGRLDKDSEGLLILSNDDVFKNKLLSPESKKTKTYWVQVEGAINAEAIAKLQAGVRITVQAKAYKTLPAKAHILPLPPNLPERIPPIRFRANISTSWIQIEIVEGKNRQIRKMTAAVGFPTLRLVRAAANGWTIAGMIPGDVKEVHLAL
jgi:23S rRNA pseudouridine2457 synthase